MATTDGKNAYVNIMELPQISDIESGDFLVVETPSGTSIINFENFLISPSNITFSEVITTNTSNIAVLSAEIDNVNTTLNAQFSSLSAELTQEQAAFVLSVNTTLNTISSLKVDTYAVFALTGYNVDGVKLYNSSNISTASFDSVLSCVRLNFIRNFTTDLYGVTTGSTISSFVSVKSVSDISTNSINTYITNASGGFTTAQRCTINLIGGTLI
jgi:hypothetical protein